MARYTLLKNRFNFKACAIFLGINCIAFTIFTYHILITYGLNNPWLFVLGLYGMIFNGVMALIMGDSLYYEKQLKKSK